MAPVLQPAVSDSGPRALGGRHLPGSRTSSPGARRKSKGRGQRV